MAGLHDVFTMGAHKARDAHNARLATLEGGLPAIGGGESAPGSPNSPGVPSLAPGTAVDTSFANMAQNLATGNPNIAAANPGLFSGNHTAQGAINTAVSGLGSLFGGLVGLGPANAISSGLGKLSQFAVNRGLLGQATDGSMGLSQSAINAAFGLAPGTGPNVAAALSQGLPGTVGQQAMQMNAAPFGRVSGPDPEDGPPGPPGQVSTVDEDGNPAVSNDPGGGTGPGAGSASGPGGSAGSPSGGGDSGNPGDFHKGGTVRAKKKGGDVRITAQDDEEVIRRSEARRPGVRAALKAINEPGEGPVERGLSALFRKRG